MPFLPPRESAKSSADTAAQTQEARLTPFPGTGEFRPRRASAFLAAFGGGDAPLPGRGARGGTGHPDLRPGFGRSPLNLIPAPCAD